MANAAKVERLLTMQGTWRQDRAYECTRSGFDAQTALMAKVGKVDEEGDGEEIGAITSGWIGHVHDNIGN